MVYCRMACCFIDSLLTRLSYIFVSIVASLREAN